uniref:Uncharacterized protein n=1 Tax=Chlamydomonas euryale TaxID=1486919 RepID=A0A7R9YZB6_9CHLO|mmetsp:Transcript_35913/g.106143  ORF Transcript_35913/g.106143 Transcript_35913/m.106143 type:complete len:120 (+) Transcript_35913:396-755(+)
MWGSHASSAKGSPQSSSDQLHQRVAQLSTGVIALPHDIASEPCKGLMQVMQHVQVAAPSLVRSTQQLRALLEELKGIQEEVQDSAAALEDMGCAGAAALRRAEGHVARAAATQAEHSKQ